MLKNKKLIIIILFVMIFGITIVYSSFSQQLAIKTNGTIASTWGITFTNITSTTTGGGSSLSATIAGTSIGMNVSLSSPGDSVTYTITVENVGGLNAIVSAINATDLSDEAILFTITEIQTGDILNAGATDTFKVTITYNPAVTSQPSITSNELTLNITYIQYAGQSIPANSPVVVNQYNYVTDHLMLRYDAINNTQTGHSDNVTTWKDLSGNNHDGTITGGTWQNGKSLYLPSGATVDTGIVAASAWATASDWTMSITYKILSVPTNNTTYGDTGVIFGAGSYGGYGIIWTRPTTQTYINNYGFNRSTTNSNTVSVITPANLTLPSNILVIDLVYNTTTGLKSYRNGVIVSSSATLVTGTYTTGLGNIGINKKQIYGGNNSTAYAEMVVYSARIYNKSLTQAEITKNYNSDVYRFGI